MISRKSIATGWRRAIVRIACSSTSRCSASSRGSVADDLMGERGVGGGERIHGVDHHFLGEAAHLRDAPLEQVEVLVVGSDGMLVHHGVASR